MFSEALGGTTYLELTRDDVQNLFPFLSGLWVSFLPFTVLLLFSVSFTPPTPAIFHLPALLYYPAAGSVQP